MALNTFVHGLAHIAIRVHDRDPDGNVIELAAD
jgi:hypothetical protein